MSAPARKRLVPLRRSLIIAASFIALATLGAFLASGYVFVYVPATHEVATTSLGEASRQVETHLHTMVQRVERAARLSHDWGSQGLIDIENVERFNKLMRPILQHGQV